MLSYCSYVSRISRHLFFFFSSRRRHTRWTGDWSSDVCSSDLDPKWGETPCAFVEVKAGVKVTEEELIEHCRANLARFKAPRHVVFGVLPKTSTGKIQKFLLRQQARSEERRVGKECRSRWS